MKSREVDCFSSPSIDHHTHADIAVALQYLVRIKIPGRKGGRHLSEIPVGKQVIADFIQPGFWVEPSANLQRQR